MKQEIFRMERVTYQEHGVVLLQDFQFQIYQGEIMGMIPINNHGLGALLKLLPANLPLNDGYIYYCSEKSKFLERAVEEREPYQCHFCKKFPGGVNDGGGQYFCAAPGVPPGADPVRLLKAQMQPFLEDIGMDIPGDRYVEELTIFERVVVELLRGVILEII